MPRSVSQAARVAALLGGVTVALGFGLAARTAAAVDLYLEVFVNGTSSTLIAAFRQEAGDTFLVDPDDLRSVGLEPDPATVRADGMIDLATLPGVTYRYDAAGQTMSFDVVPEARVTTVLDGTRGGATPPPQGSPARALILNYALSAGLARDGFSFGARLDPRLSGAFGSLTSGFTISIGDGIGVARRSTTFTRAVADRMLIFRAGDVITGSLDWTRSVRLGGFQLQRSFSLRPDLVTFPVPEFAGTAAVPSTVEVYINGIRRFAEQVPAGPFSIDRVPLVTGAGDARLVLTDETGAATVIESPFFASSTLLARGLVDFSVETGLPRLGYGTATSRYLLMPAASATVRFGLTDRVTIEGHAEATFGLIQAGAGVVAQLGYVGLVSGSVAASRAGGETGFRVSGKAELALGPVSLELGTWRSFGRYSDIGTVTADCAGSCGDVPVARDHAGLALPLGPVNASLTYTRLVTTDDRSRLVAGTVSTGIGRTSIFATAYREFGDEPSFGVFGGFSAPLGANLRSSVAARQTADGIGLTTTLSGGRQDGPLSWTVRGNASASPAPSGELSYAGDFARFSASAGFDRGRGFAAASMSGAVVAAGGGFFFANRIEDGFAVVDTGMPGVDVYLDNRLAGTTNERGLAFLTGLRSYEENSVALDLTNLPPSATMTWTTATLVPGQGGGVIARFEVDEGVGAAVIVLRDAAGALIPPGSTARLEDGTELFLVGYDGIAYITGLASTNHLLVQVTDGTICVASFGFVPVAGVQGNVEATCLREGA